MLRITLAWLIPPRKGNEQDLFNNHFFELLAGKTVINYYKPINNHYSQENDFGLAYSCI